VIAALAEVAARVDGALVALDFDGTLSPIVPKPSDARPAPGAVEVLHALAVRGTQVAVVTGRDVRTVLELSGLDSVPGLIVYGLHGAEHWRDGDLVTRDEPSGIVALRQELPSAIAPYDGVWLEDKRLSLVVHTRRAVNPRLAYEALRPVITTLAAGHGLAVHDGKEVIEIRIGDVSKADAVRSLLEVGPTAALFAGDDLGDLPAFEAVHGWATTSGRPATTVAVGDEPAVTAAAQLHVDSPADLVELLSGLL